MRFILIEDDAEYWADFMLEFNRQLMLAMKHGNAIKAELWNDAFQEAQLNATQIKGYYFTPDGYPISQIPEASDIEAYYQPKHELMKEWFLNYSTKPLKCGDKVSLNFSKKAHEAIEAFVCRENLIQSLLNIRRSFVYHPDHKIPKQEHLLRVSGDISEGGYIDSIYLTLKEVLHVDERRRLSLHKNNKDITQGSGSVRIPLQLTLQDMNSLTQDMHAQALLGLHQVAMNFEIDSSELLKNITPRAPKIQKTSKVNSKKSDTVAGLANSREGQTLMLKPTNRSLTQSFTGMASCISGVKMTLTDSQTRKNVWEVTLDRPKDNSAVEIIVPLNVLVSQRTYILHSLGLGTCKPAQDFQSSSPLVYRP